MFKNLLSVISAFNAAATVKKFADFVGMTPLIIVSLIVGVILIIYLIRNSAATKVATKPTSTDIGLDSTNNKTVEFFSNGGKIIVLYYSPSCPHCTELIPIWNRLTQKFKKTKKNVKLMKVNCDRNPEAPRKFNFKGVPHIILFSDGKQTVYANERTEIAIENFINMA